jgi:hypothetical protein
MNMTGKETTMETVTERKQEERAAMLQKMRELGTPGAPHRQLAAMEGNWTTKTLSWESPDLPPRKSTGTSRQKMILDGRFLQNVETGDMMGTPYTGIGITGFDNSTRKFVTLWMSSTSTAVFHVEGTASDDRTVIYQSRPMDTPMGSMKFRIVTHMIDDDHYRFEMYGSGESGRENKMMETLYSRQK